MFFLRPSEVSPFIYLRPGIGSSASLEGSCPGIVMSQGPHWKEQRRFMLRNLRDQGFGKTSMEDSLLEEVEKFCNALRKQEGETVNLVRTKDILWGS